VAVSKTVGCEFDPCRPRILEKGKIADCFIFFVFYTMLERINLYMKESYNELTEHVEWPSWSSLQSTTIVVLVSTLVIAAVIFLMDAASGSLLRYIYSI
jgi:preprotein translocase subunit SecE